MKPERAYKLFGDVVSADDIQNTSTAWHYGGAWILWVPDGGGKRVITQSLDPVYGIWWVSQYRKLQEQDK